MIADDFNDIAVRLKQIEQKTESPAVRFLEEAGQLPQMIVPRRFEAFRVEAPNVEFVQ